MRFGTSDDVENIVKQRGYFVVKRESNIMPNGQSISLQLMGPNGNTTTIEPGVGGLFDLKKVATWCDVVDLKKEETKQRKEERKKRELD